MRTKTGQPVQRKRIDKHFTLSKDSLALLEKYKSDFDGNESRVIDASLKAYDRENESEKKERLAS